jgi:folate-binding protein YgfZ
MGEIAAFSRLSDASVLQLDGTDAVRFAQAQFMNDVASLEVGRWQWNGWLNAKGRVIALFLLARPGADRLWLVLPDLPAAALLPRLQRMVFRSKVTLSLPDLEAFATSALSPPAGDALAPHGDAWALSPDGHRVLALRAIDAAPADAEATRRWRDADLAAGIPRLDAAQGEQWTPHMLSLQRLSAFSVRKGCYPGQEIVARTHFLGQSRRGLWHVRGVDLRCGELSDAEGRAVGQIIAVASDGRLGLAVAPVGTPTAGWQCEGRPVDGEPLDAP